MNNEEQRALAARLERLAGQQAARLEQLMGAPEAEDKKSREALAMLKELLALARELRGDEARDVVVRFLGDSAAGSV